MALSHSQFAHTFPAKHITAFEKHQASLHKRAKTCYDTTILSEGLDALSLPYADETLHRFRLFYTLLSERSQQMNLTAISGEADVARLHMLDCAAILPLVSFTGKRVLDVGSGAGFPGLVLKLLCPDLSLTLLDSTQKRVQFQKEACTGPVSISVRRRPPPGCAKALTWSSPAQSHV